MIVIGYKRIMAIGWFMFPVFLLYMEMTRFEWREPMWVFTLPIYQIALLYVAYMVTVIFLIVWVMRFTLTPKKPKNQYKKYTGGREV
jgi:uncharacterized membrane protein